MTAQSATTGNSHHLKYSLVLRVRLYMVVDHNQLQLRYFDADEKLQQQTVNVTFPSSSCDVYSEDQPCRITTQLEPSWRLHSILIMVHCSTSGTIKFRRPRLELKTSRGISLMASSVLSLNFCSASEKLVARDKRPQLELDVVMQGLEDVEDSLTIAIQASVDRVGSLGHLQEVWHGPVTVIVYLPKEGSWRVSCFEHWH